MPALTTTPQGPSASSFLSSWDPEEGSYTTFPFLQTVNMAHSRQCHPPGYLAYIVIKLALEHIASDNIIFTWILSYHAARADIIVGFCYFYFIF